MRRSIVSILFIVFLLSLVIVANSANSASAATNPVAGYLDQAFETRSGGVLDDPTADKPQMACLSSRLPYGETVTPEKLNMIEQAEYVLRDLGFYDVRVRHHELRSELQVLNSKPETRNSEPATVKHLARIEVGAEVVGVARALGGEAGDQPLHPLRAAVPAGRVGRVPARDQRGGALPALGASVLVDGHVPTILP